MPTITFYSDFKKDLEYIKKHFPIFKKISNNYFDNMIKSIYPKCYKKSDKVVLAYFKKNKRKIIIRNKTEGDKLKQGWNKINNDFFKQVEDITGFKWKSKIYHCHISSSYLYGGYNKPNIVVICPYMEESMATLAHELIHLHLLEILKDLKIELNKKDYWKVSETIVPFIISKLKIKETKHKTELGYRELLPLYKKLKILTNKNFRKLIIKYVKIVKEI